MAKYKLAENGVLDTEEEKFIPIEEKNKDYKEYLKWVDDGNTPDPIYTEEELIEQEEKEALADLQATINGDYSAVIVALVEIYEVGIANNRWDSTDFTDQTVEAIAKWKELLTSNLPLGKLKS